MAPFFHPNVILNEVKNLFTPSTRAINHRRAPRQEITGVCRSARLFASSG
jgi:hypothetical protein